MKLRIKGLALSCCLGSISHIVYAEQLSINAGFDTLKIANGIAMSYNKEPVINISITYDFLEDFYSGINLTYSNSQNSLSLSRELSPFIGFFHVLDDEKALEFSLARHIYDGNENNKAQQWSHNNLDLTYFHNQQLSASFTYTNDYFGRGFSSSLINVNWQYQISDNNYMLLGAGRVFFYDSEASGEYYNLELGTGYDHNRWNYQLIYSYAHRAAEIIHGEDTAGGKLQLTVKYSMY